MAILDEMFGETDVDVDKWQKENEGKKTGKSGYLPEYKLKDKKPDNIGLVSFLNEGLLLKVHSIRYFDNGKERFHDLLCLGDGCPLCKKSSATKQAHYLVIDWLNSYMKKDEVVAYPRVKLFSKGLNTAKLIAARKEKYGSLLNKKWEIRRDGTGFQTYYDILLEEKDVVIDLVATKQIPSEQGPIEVLEISRPTTWPEYVEGSVYAKKQLKPNVELNFANPDHVKTFIQCYMLNEPPLMYERGLAGIPQSNMAKKPESNKPAPEAPMSTDLPF